MTVTSAHDDWLRRVPKIELHVHLEGAIPYATLWELLDKYGGDPNVPDQEALIRKFAYRDFRHFIETWNWKNGFLREYEDFTIIAEAVARDLARQNVRYVEAFYSPIDFRRHGLQTQRVTAAIRSGLDQVPEIEIALVADLVRNSALAAAERTLEELRDVQDLGVVGIGLGGSEKGFPPEPFADLYEEARRMSFRTTAHAGEGAGPESIWGAIRFLEVERLGHGTRAEEDESLLGTTRTGSGCGGSGYARGMRLRDKVALVTGGVRRAGGRDLPRVRCRGSRLHSRLSRRCRGSGADR